MLGFGIFADPHVVLDTITKLISTLVERWRLVTNTFFTRHGEMTITLEDVDFILGLHVEGDALTCGVIENKAHYFVSNWFEPLTDEDVGEALYRNNIKLSWLFDRYGREKPEKNNMLATFVHMKAYILFVMGCIIFPTNSRSFVHVRYIHPLINMREIPYYGWGAAVLAHLYRGLENAVRKGSKTIACCAWLLQVWSYERFSRIGVPARSPGREDYLVAKGWAYSTHQGVTKKRRKEGPHHNLPFYRGEFDGVAGDEGVVEFPSYAMIWSSSSIQTGWARFCSDLDVDDSVDITSEADYMAWYADVSRVQIGKPEPHPQNQYKTRELYDSLEGYEVTTRNSKTKSTKESIVNVNEIMNAIMTSTAMHDIALPPLDILLKL
ncbi:hypothetical protein AgCh_031183 [Apium graveolens]